MLNFFKQHYQFLLILLSWVLASAVSPLISIGLIPLTILLLKIKDRYTELFIGFLFILIISDSLNPIFSFATTGKAIYLILLTLLFVLNNKAFTNKNHFILPFIPFFIVALFSLLNNPTPFIATQKTVSYILLYFAIPAYVQKCLSDNEELFLKYLVFFSALILMTGLLLAFITPSYSIFGNRFSGIFGNPNGVGLFSSIIFVLVTVIFKGHPKLFSANEKRIVYAVIIISVLFSISRNSIFAILIFLLFERFYNISNWLGFVILILIVLLYQVIAMNLGTIITMLGLKDYLRLETLESGSGRLVAWNFAWEYVKDHFVFGKGFTYDDYLFGIHQMALRKIGHFGGVHNLYLSMWLNTGIIGLICFMYGFFKTIMKATKYSKLALPIMFSFLFSLTFEGWLMGSLNAYNIGFVTIFSILLYQPINEPDKKHTLS